MGTAVGAIIFCFLCLRRFELEPLLFGTFGVTPRAVCKGVSVCAAACADAAAAVQSHPISLDATRLTLLAVYGLVYCYVASAPILVFHAGRFLISPGIRVRSVFRSNVFWMCASLAVVFWTLARFLGDKGNWFALTAFALTLLLELQVVAICRSVSGSAKLFRFYKRLAAHRKKDGGELVESYRHLREHGNSFFIVFLEISLGVVLFQASKLAPEGRCSEGPALGLVEVYLVVLVAWILPAVFVWLISTRFERRFADAVVPPELPPLPRVR
jgi:hypothetical protein